MQLVALTQKPLTMPVLTAGMDNAWGDMDTATRSALELRRRQSQWLNDLKDRLGMSFSAMAREAEISPSTLLGIGNRPDTSHALSSSTINALVATFQVNPPDGSTKTADGYRNAAWQAVYLLAERKALSPDIPPDQAADAVANLADWIAQEGMDNPALASVADYQARTITARQSA